MTESCECVREMTFRDYLCDIFNVVSDDRYKALIDKTIKRYDDELKLANNQRMEAMEEHDRTVQKLNAYRIVLADIIRYETRWD